jgi:perosamine synthetase
MIPVNRPVLGKSEAEKLQACIDTEWISSEGPFVRQLETDVARLLGREHGVAVCNGSAALDLAVGVLRLGPGDEVILPTFTIISCAAAIVRAGATPVVVDCDPATWNMDPEAVARAITPRTRAIMAVHIYGLPVDLDPILVLAREHGLFVIEDAAEQMGQTYKGRPVGSFGEVSTVSFYPNKLITTGEGGMLLADDASLYERARGMRNLCFDSERRYIHAELGWNFRMSNLQAAVGVAQFGRVPEALERKRKLGLQYRAALEGHPLLQLPVHETDYATNAYWIFGVVLADACELDAAAAIRRLRAAGVDCRHFFWPMHQQPALLDKGLFAGEKHPNAERLAQRGFYLPSGIGTTEAEVERAAEALKEILS